MTASDRAPASETAIMIDIRVTEARLRDHVRALTVDIGERSVLALGNLKRAAGHIRDFYQGIGLPARLEPYDFQGFEVANVVAEVHLDPNPSRRILIGAHYDSVAGTVGADDNASAVAAQLETAGQVMALNSFRKNREMPVVKLTVPFNGWIPPAVRLSDHASFWNEGFKAVMITDSAFYRNPHYHLPSDRPERLDFRFMAERVPSLVTFLAQPP